jgi:hypothetical protein
MLKMVEFIIQYNIIYSTILGKLLSLFSWEVFGNARKVGNGETVTKSYLHSKTIHYLNNTPVFLFQIKKIQNLSLGHTYEYIESTWMKVACSWNWCITSYTPRLDVLKAMNIKTAVFWDMTLCSLVDD